MMIQYHDADGRTAGGETDVGPPRAVVPSTTPMLRIDAGHHHAPIKRIDCDAAELILATASDDKTVRLWSLPDGRLLRVLRPPIGEGDEGRLLAVAISPDGRLVATGGHTGADWDGSFSVYLFDTASGRMLRRLAGLENLITHLTFAPDGKHLAVCLAGGAGVRVWRCADWQAMVIDREYGGDSYGACFDRGGLLATTCYDGQVRLYDVGGRRLAQATAPSANEPYGVAFSPDGDRLAVGYADAPVVSVLGANRLVELYLPNALGIRGGDFASVAWCGRSRCLYAAGRAIIGAGTYAIRRWADDGHGRATDLAAAGNTIMDLHPYRGGVLFGSAGPDIGAFDAQGTQILSIPSTTADLRGSLGPHFRVSGDGATVRFGLLADGGNPAIFSVIGRRLETEGQGAGANGAAANGAPLSGTGLNGTGANGQATNGGGGATGTLVAPVVRTGRLIVTGWEDATDPTVNGQPLPLEPFEISRCLAITPDEQHLLIGTDWHLYQFDVYGRRQWRWPASGTVWGVNVSGNGRLVVAAYDDGTIRWHRTGDGELVLALFVHRDGSRWVLWTPDGFFDAAAGAETLIGWHVNRGVDEAADFFPASQFRDRFLRPQEMDRVFGGVAAATALRGLLPPVLTILTPGDGEAAAGGGTPVAVAFEVRSPSGAPLTRLRVMVDGRPLESAPLEMPTADGAGVRRITLTLPRAAGELVMIAETPGAVSMPARLALQGTTPLTAFPVVTGVPKPMLYALCVGVNGFVGGENTLQYATKDAADMAAVLNRQVGGLYRDIQVQVLNHGRVNREEIVRGLDWLRRSTTSSDVAVLFLAGHGINDVDGRYYFLPETGDLQALRATAVAGIDLVQILAATPGKRIAFLDTCHAGNLFGRHVLQPRSVVNLDRLVNELSSAENGVIAFASSTGGQDSYESPNWENGAFTQAILEALGGAGDLTADRAISINELNFYVSERVKTLTNGVQSPNMLRPDSIRDFPFAMVVAGVV